MKRDPREKREQDWNDVIPDDENDQPEDRGETYRDGSAKNECWGDRSYD